MWSNVCSNLYESHYGISYQNIYRHLNDILYDSEKPGETKYVFPILPYSCISKINWGYILYLQRWEIIMSLSLIVAI